MEPNEILDDVPPSGDNRLDRKVALTVALLASFMGVCKVKDDNIVQGMQQAQADKIDHWAFYQARNLRQEQAHTTLLQLRLAALVPTGVGVFYGVAGLFGLPFHPGWLTGWLS